MDLKRLKERTKEIEAPACIACNAQLPSMLRVVVFDMCPTCYVKEFGSLKTDQEVDEKYAYWVNIYKDL